jgi:predicted RNA-binding protein
MCESNAFLKRGTDEELLLACVARVDPTEDGFLLTGLFGEEVNVKGKLEEVNLLAHKIVFTPKD